MDLLADRFLVCDQRTAVDLASGDRVELIVSANGGVAEQARWALRCDRFAGVHHRWLARLIDYGPLGETRRFEAWRVDGRWRGSLHENERVRSHVAEFFRASAWTSGAIDARSIRQRHGRAVILPDSTAGFDLDDGGADAQGSKSLSSVSDLALGEISRTSVGRIAEMFGDRFARGCRTIALCGAPGSGRDTAALSLARAARLRGFVPLAARMVRPELAAVLDGRSVALFIRSDTSHGWRAFVRLSLISRKPHVALFVGASCPRGVCDLMLERVSAEALESAVLPRPGAEQFRKRISAAARRARGLPGRFDALIWGGHDMEEADRTKHSQVAEPAPEYDRESGPPMSVEPGGRVVEWPAPGELATLRKRLQSAVAWQSQGRHAAGDRTLRQVGASLARRHDWDHASQANLALAASLLRRGRPRDAQSVLTQTREMTTHICEGELVNRLTILTGLALTDDGRLDEAETVLTAAVAAAWGLDERQAHRSATLALARCLFWRGRFDSAVDHLKKIDESRLCDEEAVRLAVMRARLAVGLGDFENAIAQSTSALERARRLSNQDLLAMSACAVAFAHLSVGDHPGVAADVAEGVQMARRAHDPLRALRIRLISAESQRRQGRRGPALALTRRTRRLQSSPLPFLLRAQVDLLSELLIPANSDDRLVVKRHCQTTGLASLALFAPVRQAASQQAAAAADIVNILQCCQTADEETRVLDGLCARLRCRLQAVGVAFFTGETGSFTQVASDGTRIDPSLAGRVAAVDQVITPHFLSGRLEAGAPVRYGGRQLGVLLVRWSLGTACDSTDVVMLLSTAATAAGPAVAGILGRRNAGSPRTSELIGTSASMVDIRAAIERASAAPFAVLVEGESGTGKELVARALHRQSPRRDRPFCALNCAALPDDLLESELFGHSRGAFTGALAERPGVFEEAHTGTLFLDEIGELSLRAQAKVLRTVQEGELRRVGENIPRRVDVRVVAATNRDLRREVAAGRFRLDLLYRLDVIRISLPPLRSRRDDIPLLAEHFWRDATSRVGSRASLSLATLTQLARYDWPGNVRELQNVLAALAVRTPRRGVVPPSALPPNFDGVAPERPSRLDAARKTFDTQFIRAALVRTGGHRARAAEELGVTRQGLTKLMVRLGLNTSSTLNAEP